MIKQGYTYSDITSKIIGCAMKIHSSLGNWFQEVIYQRALDIEFRKINIQSNREFEMPIYYDAEQIGTRRVDFLIENVISVELKAITRIEKVHFTQAINYLEAFNLQIGLLINFGNQSLEFHRLINHKFRKSKS